MKAINEDEITVFSDCVCPFCYLGTAAMETYLDEAEVRSAVDGERLDSELERRFEEAQQMSVTGIPTFAYDGHAARGAIPPEQFERLVEEV